MNSNRSGTALARPSAGEASSTAAPGACRSGPAVGLTAVALVTSSARPAQIPTIVKLPPRLNARRGERETAREYLNGFSTRRNVIQAGITDATTTAVPRATDRPPQ